MNSALSLEPCDLEQVMGPGYTSVKVDVVWLNDLSGWSVFLLESRGSTLLSESPRPAFRALPCGKPVIEK